MKDIYLITASFVGEIQRDFLGYLDMARRAGSVSYTHLAPAITGDMVEELVAKSTETTVFLLAKALVSGQYETAYNLLDLSLIHICGQG